MIPLPSGTKVWLATSQTDIQKEIGGLSLLVLGRDPFCGHLFVFLVRRHDYGGPLRVHGPASFTLGSSSGELEDCPLN